MAKLKYNLNNTSQDIMSLVNAGHLDLPSNLKRYEYPGDFADQCPLCGDLHEEYRSVVMRDSSVYVCHTCSNIVDEYIAVGANTTKPIVHKLQTYIDTGRLGADAVRWSKSLQNSCYFCRRSIDQNKECMDLKLPIGEGCNGGSVKICSDCSENIGWEELHHKHTDSCISCKQEYPLADDEVYYRNKTNTRNKYLCGDCFQEIHGTLYQERFINRECNKCKVPKVIDLFTILDTREVPSAKTFICKGCQFPYQFVHSCNDNGTILVGINKRQDNNKYYYTVIRAESPDKIHTAKKIIISEAIYTRVFDCTEDGLEMARRMYPELSDNYQSKLMF